MRAIRIAIAILILLAPAITTGHQRDPQRAKNKSVKTYKTRFQVDENPITERGKWLNGRNDGLDWYNVVTEHGVAHGAVSQGAYTDPTALLAGTWGRNQIVNAKVFSRNQTEKYYQEVEIRLRSNLTPHRCTGYEVFWRCLKTEHAYVEIVRWNGKVGDWTSLKKHTGARFGVQDGDSVSASIVGDVIKGYLNGVEVISARDNTYHDGNPGMGFNYGVEKTNGDFGFTSYEVESFDSLVFSDRKGYVLASGRTSLAGPLETATLWCGEPKGNPPDWRTVCRLFRPPGPNCGSAAERLGLDDEMLPVTE
jgi:hypothetical protein